MSEVLVIGHRNPDTDAICSAIGYAEFKRRTGLPEAEAARCGDINERIKFVLRSFGMPPPRFVADVSPKVRDVMQGNVASVSTRTTVAEALAIMDDRIIRVLPVMNADGTCKGLVSVFKMSKFFFPTPQRPFDSRRLLVTVRHLADTLSGRLIHARNEDQEEDLILMIGAMSVDSFSERLKKYPRERLVVVTGDRRELQELAIREGVRVVIVTGGFGIDEAMTAAAGENGVSLILSPHDTATTAMFCRAAIAVDHMIHEHFLALREDEPLSAVQGIATASQFHAFPVVDENDRMVGILSKSDFLKKVERQLILVDHNELSQAVRGADRVEILEIIDHHRIGTLSTQQPILFRNEPVGSTSTIVAGCFFQNQVALSPAIAGLLLAGLVSDTLNLTSPTTTERDVEVLARLEKIAGVNAREFTEKLFESGSLLTSRPAGEAITTDCKEYEELGRRFSVAQIEEIGFDQFWKRKDEVKAALEEYRRAQRYFFSALLVTDVVRQTTLLLVTGEESFVRLIKYPEVERGIHELQGIVSRKKQVLPYLMHCLGQVG
jgi:manganese-dependent inorganic pyrophosphatase